MDVHFRKKGVVKSSHEFLTHFELEMVFKSIVPGRKVGNSISGFPFLEKYDLSDIRFFYGYSSTAKKGNCRNPFTY